MPRCTHLTKPALVCTSSGPLRVPYKSCFGTSKEAPDACGPSYDQSVLFGKLRSCLRYSSTGPANPSGRCENTNYGGFCIQVIPGTESIQRAEGMDEEDLSSGVLFEFSQTCGEAGTNACTSEIAFGDRPCSPAQLALKQATGILKTK